MSFTAGSQGGEYNHKLTIQEMPMHLHNDYAAVEGYDGWPKTTIAKYSLVFKINDGYYNYEQKVVPAAEISLNARGSYVGGDANHNNTQPYITVYIWHRVA